MRIFGLELDNNLKGVDQRMRYIESLIARLDRPDLVVLPELALSSYMANQSIWAYADENSQITSAWAKKMAEKYNTFIAVGYVEQSQGEYYNSYLIADQTTVYGIVRKSEAESYVFKRGRFENIIMTPFGEVAVAICYDARRIHFYQNIKDRNISLILFPHGSPADPQKTEVERQINDALCNKYVQAFGVPVMYVNSVGRMDYMPGTTGQLMVKSGFRLNGLSQIYSRQGNPLSTDIAEAIGTEVDLETKQTTGELKFYGENITRGNFLFRKIIMPLDIRAGIRSYEKRKRSD